MKIRTLLAAALAVALACPAHADTKISQFPLGGNLTVGDIVPVVRSGTNYQATYTGAASGVASFNTRTGTVTLTAPDVGAVLLTSASAHQFITGLNSSGVFTFAQPAFTDISGTISGAQLPTPTTSVLGGIIAQASSTTHQVVQYVNTSGQQILAQLGFSDLSGTLSLPQLGTSYTNGQVLIGSTTDGQFHAATLTAGTNITITNAAGSITINSSGGGGGVSSFNSRTGAVSPTSGDYTVSQVTGAAPLASPTFTGTVTLPAATVVNGVTLTTGGTSTTFLNGAGSYTTPAGGGTPGGSTGQIQYNNSGAFGGLALGAGLAISSGVLAPSMQPGVKTADYTVVTTDTFLALNSTSPHTFTLPQAGTTGFPSGWCVNFANYNTGVLTIAPTTSAINGAPTTLAQYGFASVCSDGTNYEGQGSAGGTALVQSLGSGLTLTSGVLSASGGGSSAFSALTGSTNTTAAMLVGSGASLAATGTGTITPTTINGLITNGANVTITGSGTVASPYTIAASSSASTNLGASTSAASPQIAGDATSGLYTAGAAKVDVVISTSKVAEWGTAGEALTGTDTITSSSSSALTVGPNGSTTPALNVDASASTIVNGVSIVGKATGSSPVVQAVGSDTNLGITLASKGTGNVSLSVNSSNVVAVTSTGVNVAPAVNAGASTIRFKYNPAADLTLTASTNAVITSFAGAGVTRQHSTGALALQEDYLFTGTTDSFVGASTETVGATMAFLLPGCGTNATCTNLVGLYHASTALTVTGTTNNSYGLWLEADTGATNNYAANFKGDITLTGTAPGVTSCGSGSIVTGSSDHKGQISGVTTATTCTITFGQGPLGTAPACSLMGGTSGALSGAYISAISTSAVTFTFSSYSGTLYYLCF